MSDYITLTEAAKQFGISKTTLHKRLTNDCNAPKNIGKNRGRGCQSVYLLSALMNWHNSLERTANGRVILNNGKQQGGQRKNTFSKTLARQFICGAIDPARQRERHRIKSLAARHFKHHIKQTQHIKGDL